MNNKFNNWDEVLNHIKKVGTTLVVGVCIFYIDNYEEYYESYWEDGDPETKYYENPEDMLEDIKIIAANNVSNVKIKQKI